MISMIKVTRVKTPQKDKKGISDKGCKWYHWLKQKKKKKNEEKKNQNLSCDY